MDGTFRFHIIDAEKARTRRAGLTQSATWEDKTPRRQPLPTVEIDTKVSQQQLLSARMMASSGRFYGYEYRVYVCKNCRIVKF